MPSMQQTILTPAVRWSIRNGANPTDDARPTVKEWNDLAKLVVDLSEQIEVLRQRR